LFVVVVQYSIGFRFNQIREMIICIVSAKGFYSFQMIRVACIKRHLVSVSILSYLYVYEGVAVLNIFNPGKSWKGRRVINPKTYEWKSKEAAVHNGSCQRI
jgi:hypothetical protein